VLAGPGSGKTYTIVSRIVHLIERCHVPPDNILVITFTKAAAQEMQSRFLTAIGKTCATVHFGTFHSIYYQILSRSGYLQNFSLIKPAEQLRIIRRLLRQDRPHDNIDRTECEALLHDIGRLKNLEPPVGSFENIESLYSRYTDMLKTLKKMDFDDMILYCHEMLMGSPTILSQWQQYFTHILVDEFQDINRRQYQILRLLAAPDNHLFIVGDDDQSIYGFRGARPAVMKEFIDDFPDAVLIQLEINYRSTHPIIAAADAVITLNQQRLEKHYHALRDGNEVTLHAFPNKEQEDQYLLNSLKALDQGRHSETAVILRTNLEVSLLASKCTKMGIPISTTEKTIDLFAHFIANDIIDYLRFSTQEPTRARYLNIINKPARYLSGRAVADLTDGITEERLLEYYQGKGDDQAVIRRFFADCHRIARLSPYLAIHFIRKGIGYDRYLKERARPEEYEEWQEIANTIQESARDHSDCDSWLQFAEEHSQPLPKSLNSPLLSCDKPKATQSPIKSGDRAGQSGQGIRLITMHGSKGLEFDTVYLPHLNEGTIPGKRSLTAGQIEEERRLFYVGMTRAKEQLCLLYTTSPKQSPSRFLEPLLSHYI
jgi:DNA helicase-2/ATP-dependent DNA helicase PcrA